MHAKFSPRTAVKSLGALAIALLISSAMNNLVWAANSINFPGSVKELPSPNAQYNVKSEANGKSDLQYKLILTDAKHHDTKIREYMRNVDILWSPNSKNFIVNDWMTSSEAEPFLYSVGTPSKPIDVGQKFAAAVKDKGDKECMEKSDHLYVFVSKWLGPDSVEIKAAGHGGGKLEFTLYYTWDLKDSFKRVKKIDTVDTTRDVPQTTS